LARQPGPEPNGNREGCASRPTSTRRLGANFERGRRAGNGQGLADLQRRALERGLPRVFARGAAPPTRRQRAPGPCVRRSRPFPGSGLRAARRRGALIAYLVFDARRSSRLVGRLGPPAPADGRGPAFRIAILFRRPRRHGGRDRSHRRRRALLRSSPRLGMLCCSSPSASPTTWPMLPPMLSPSPTSLSRPASDLRQAGVALLRQGAGLASAASVASRPGRRRPRSGRRPPLRPATEGHGNSWAPFAAGVGLLPYTDGGATGSWPALSGCCAMALAGVTLAPPTPGGPREGSSLGVRSVATALGRVVRSFSMPPSAGIRQLPWHCISLGAGAWSLAASSVGVCLGWLGVGLHDR